jgi:hypothetical protein
VSGKVRTERKALNLTFACFRRLETLGLGDPCRVAVWRLARFTDRLVRRCLGTFRRLPVEATPNKPEGVVVQLSASPETCRDSYQMSKKRRPIASDGG